LTNEKFTQHPKSSGQYCYTPVSCILPPSPLCLWQKRGARWLRFSPPARHDVRRGVDRPCRRAYVGPGHGMDDVEWRPPSPSLIGRSFARHGIVNSPSLWAPAATHYSGPIVRRLLAVGARVNVTGLDGGALWGRTWPAASPTRYRADGPGRLYGHDGRPITSGGVEAARQAVSAGDEDMVCLLEGACGERADTRPTCCQWVFLW